MPGERHHLKGDLDVELVEGRFICQACPEHQPSINDAVDHEIETGHYTLFVPAFPFLTE